jgi:hypothetical protein
MIDAAQFVGLDVVITVGRKGEMLLRVSHGYPFIRF